jgi:hypothetical protein
MGAFIITTDSGATPSIRIPICGVGIAPALCAHPVPLDLGAAGVGQSVHGHLTLESCGTEPVTLTAVALSMDAQHQTAMGFRLTAMPTVPQTLQPMQTVDVEVTFTAQPPYGPAQGYVQATSNATGRNQSFFPVTARVASPCTLSVAPSSIVYRNVNVGMSLAKNVLVANNGDMPCTVTSASTSTSTGGGHDFTLTSTLSTPFTLVSGQAQTLQVTFRPSSAGAKDATLSVVDSGGTPKRVALHGNPPGASGCAVDINPSVLNFGLTGIGTTTHKPVQVVDIGDQPCVITSARLIHHDPAFSTSLPALATVFPNIGNASIDVAYMPTMAGPSTDVLELVVTGFLGAPGGGTYQVGVFGTAGEPHICVSPNALDFGTVPAGTMMSRGVRISSCGAVDLGLRGIRMTSGPGPFHVSQEPQLPSSVTAGTDAMPALQVTYAPTNAGPHFGLIEIFSTDRQAPSVRIPLSGNRTGTCDRVLQCSPPNVLFSDTAVGSRKTVRVVCQSLGAQPVTVSSVSLAGGAPISTTAQTPATIQPGDAWTFDLVFAPSSTGMASATLNITSDACVSPAAGLVTGNGIVRMLPPCQPPMTFAPVEQWSWHTSNVQSTFTNVWSTPLVANLNDDNGDGRIDENDIPDVAFISIDNYNIMDPSAAQPGVLRVLNGITGAEEFSVTATRFGDCTIPAIGDLDGDGSPEIVGLKWIQTPPGTGTGGFNGRFTTGTLVALDHQGNFLWESDPWQWPSSVLENCSAVSIADLDGDGFAEVILGRDVFDHNGHLKWRGAGAYGQIGNGIHSIVADIDRDGHPEVIAGGTVYNGDGSIKWAVPNQQEGGTAVGMLDPMDPYPQIVLQTGSALIVFDHMGMEKWRIPMNDPNTSSTQLPALADFDGDHFADIAFSTTTTDQQGQTSASSVFVYRGRGGLLWQAPAYDNTPCCVGISAFDFEGDGSYELMAHGSTQIRIYRGDSGTVIYTAARPSITAYEIPIVANIDRTNKAKLLVAVWGMPGVGGLIAYSNSADSWVAAPPIWNEQAYHVTNVFDSGAIPRSEAAPTAPSVFRASSPACR